MKDDSQDRWVLVSVKPASDGHHKQLSDVWMPVLATTAAVLRGLHRASGIETLLVGKPRLVRRAKKILRGKKYTLKRAAVREHYEKPAGSPISIRDYRIAVANAAQVYAEAVEAWLVSLSSSSPRVNMSDVWQWIADQATNSSSHLSTRLRAAGHLELAYAGLDLSDGWWRGQLARKKPFIYLKQRLRRI